MNARVLNPETSVNRRPADRIAKIPWLEAIANTVQPNVQRVLGAAGVPVRNALHGTWLGHTLHPALTDVPTGAWTVTAVLDALEIVGNTRFGAGADAALVIGLLGAAGAAVTGYADWSDTADDAKTLGMAHAMLNGAATIAYVASLAARRAGNRGAGIAFAFAGYGVMSLAAYLGGELSMGLQLGVRHTAEPIFPPSDFTPVLDENALESGKIVRADLNGIPLILLRTHDGIFAMGAACTHRGAPLAEGTLEGACVRCPWHGSLFSFANGSAIEGPAAFPQPQFEARVEAGKIEVRPLQPMVASM
jgi:nitrite reductase/ring-hydroxylating ferredoxin subunit